MSIEVRLYASDGDWLHPGLGSLLESFLSSLPIVLSVTPLGSRGGVIVR
jgi:hypothetical protein